MRNHVLTLTAVLALAGCVVSDKTTPTKAGPFAEPVKLAAGGEVIEVEVGHADPFVVDLNGDGKLDLLVGQFGGGKLLFFANTGTNEAPVLAKGEFLKAGDAELKVPSG
ncbi:MAG: VCBS repeat-containing protein [Planctomycetota bacterium]